MEYRKLGASGLKLSALSYGAWVTFGTQIDEKQAAKLLKTAYDAGVNFFDNAEAYADGQAEIIMGHALRKLGWGRDTYCVSSKVFWGGDLPTQMGLCRKHIVEACHAALRRLQVDYLDLYFCHRPDPETPISETVWSMNLLLQQGKILYWGTSEWSAEQIEEAITFANREHLIAPVMEQPQYNLLFRQRFEQEYAPLFKKYQLGSTIWSPLASGMLTGKYLNNKSLSEGRMNQPDLSYLHKRYQGPEGQQRLKAIEKFVALANDVGHSPATLAIAWCLKNPNVSTVILGASKESQLTENLKALAIYQKIDNELKQKLDQLFTI